MTLHNDGCNVNCERCMEIGEEAERKRIKEIIYKRAWWNMGLQTYILDVTELISKINSLWDERAIIHASKLNSNKRSGSPADTRKGNEVKE